jgi:hypothetical protein
MCDEGKMEPEIIQEINDDPSLVSDFCGDGVTFAVRLHKSKKIVAIVTAENRDELFWAIDNFTNPYQCEVSVLVCGDAIWFDEGKPSLKEGENEDCFDERTFDRLRQKTAWRPVDDGTLFLEEKRERFARFESEVTDLRKILRGLERKTNERNA